jgi:hypothetical protein
MSKNPTCCGTTPQECAREKPQHLEKYTREACWNPILPSEWMIFMLYRLYSKHGIFFGMLTVSIQTNVGQSIHETCYLFCSHNIGGCDE